MEMFGHKEVAMWLLEWWASLCKGECEGRALWQRKRKENKRLQNSHAPFSSLLDADDHVCHSYSYGLRAIIQCLPAWFRFIQCLRRYRDTKRAFPHLVNAGKYSTTFFVVTFAALYATHRGRTHKCLFYGSWTPGSRFDLSWVNMWKWHASSVNCNAIKYSSESQKCSEKTEVSLSKVWKVNNNISVFCRSMTTPRWLLSICIVCAQKPEVTLSSNARSWPRFPCWFLELYNGNGLSNTAVDKQASALTVWPSIWKQEEMERREREVTQ